MISLKKGREAIGDSYRNVMCSNWHGMDYESVLNPPEEYTNAVVKFSSFAMEYMEIKKRRVRRAVYELSCGRDETVVARALGMDVDGMRKWLEENGVSE